MMKTGCSYPAARRQVIDSPLLDTPNNILALEYMECTQLPCTCVQRLGLGHDTVDPLYSASAIRATLPAEAIYSIEHCQRAVLAVLRRMEAADWAAIDDVTDGLENRLARAAQSATSLEELYTTIKTKRYTHARIRRIVLRAYLGIGKGDYPATPPYLRVLGFNAAGKALLAKMQHSATLPTVTRMADVKALSPEGGRCSGWRAGARTCTPWAQKSPCPAAPSKGFKSYPHKLRIRPAAYGC